MTPVQELVGRLEDLLRKVESSEWGGINLTTGVCDNANADPCDYPEIQEAVQSWKHYSGDEIYPIPATHPEIVGIGDSLYHQYHYYPKWEGEQLTLRISYMKHLIKELS